MFTECTGHLNEGKALCPSRNTRLERIPHAPTHPIKHMTVTSTTHKSQVAGNSHCPLRAPRYRQVLRYVLGFIYKFIFMFQWG